ncbi:MAG: LPS export ABC transporter periplasmic protein LptC [Elusimicrobia bacterium RIFCSPLOWO2_01_FULL_54_10]|nr:MAG: LPS export ABC transporter periplasmic protein LptC [Elusimicrobia bacterium RIFCSPLOWO2_01_FULL_54_10]
MNKNILARAKKIRLLATDVDGVLTGGEIIILDSGEEIKIWSVKDRMGFALLKHSGAPIKMAWVTARKSRQVELRAKDVGVHFLRQGSVDKWSAVKDIADSMKISANQIAYVGDDCVDYPVMKRAGLAVCPPESPELIRKTAHYQTRAAAGRGVLREVIELILVAQGRWKKAMAPFLKTFTVLALGAFLAACSSQTPPQNLTEKPDQWIEKFKITETQGGVPVWILNSEIAQRYDRLNKTTLENFTIEFMDAKAGRKKNHSRESLLLAKKNQATEAVLSAPQGEVNTETKELHAWGGVQVEARDGTVLTTERLQYSTEKKTITTEAAIRIVREDSILIGEGMEASPDLSTVKIFRHEASIYPKKIPKDQ